MKPTLRRYLALMLGILALGAVATLCVVFWIASSKTPTFSGPVEKLTLGNMLSERSALIFIAEDKGYFKDSGLDVTIKTYESGVAAVKDMLMGNVDMATCAELVVVRENMKSGAPNLKISGLINRSDDIRVVARRDHGITTISDFTGKRVGLLVETDAEYYFYLLSTLNKVPFPDLSLVNLSPNDQVSAIVDGKIDAIIVWEPFAIRAEKGLGANAVSWSAQSRVPSTWVLTSLKDTVARRGVAIQRLLSALLAAEDFVSRHVPEAQAIVGRRLNVVEPSESWHKNSFGVVLERQLILDMEARARWIKSKSADDKLKLPNMLDVIDFGNLEAVRRERVTIMH